MPQEGANVSSMALALYKSQMQGSKSFANNIKNKLKGPAFGACSGVRKKITHIKQTEKKIKDGHNGIKIGASNIFRGIKLRF